MGDRDDQLAACGYEFSVRRDLANMPDGGLMQSRAPVSAELCEIPVQVTLAEAPPLSDLDIGQFGAYRYDASCATVWIRRPALDHAWQIEALRGPVLLHALAHNDVFVLHASAVVTPGGALVAFTADSGVGKSTLARVAAELGWQRVGDDLLPIAIRDGQVVTLPHFPQPKLADSQQYPTDAPQALPLAALMHLSRGQTADLQYMTIRETANLVLASTVATRVLAGRSLASHIAFAAQLAGQLTAGRLVVGRLTVADRPGDVVGAVGEALEMVEVLLPA